MKLLRIIMHIITPILLSSITFGVIYMLCLMLRVNSHNTDIIITIIGMLCLYILPIAILVLTSIKSAKLYDKWNEEEKQKAAQNNPTTQTKEEINRKLNQIESLLKDIKDQQE